jgi:hypothetical protein
MFEKKETDGVEFEKILAIFGRERLAEWYKDWKKEKDGSLSQSNRNQE